MRTLILDNWDSHRGGLSQLRRRGVRPPPSGGMAVAPAAAPGVFVDRILATRRNIRRGFPSRIWRSDVGIEEHGGRSGGAAGEPPVLRLSHPVLQAVDACACGGRSFDQVLAQLLVSGLFQHPIAAGRVVGKLCSSRSPSSIAGALELFSRLDEPDALICNHILRAYARSGDPRGGLGFYSGHMLRRSVLPNHFTFPLLAKLCADLGVVPKGTKIHGLAIKLGLESDLFVRNSLIYMYSSFGRVDSAQQIFDSRAEFNLVTWNSIIDGYVKKGMTDRARELFDEMPERDILTWNVMIAGYAGIGDMETSRKLFDEMPERDTVSWNSMLLGYGKSCAILLARELFDAMPSPNLISWNTILAAYVRAKDYRECLSLFDRMMAMGIRPSEATLVSVLTSCAHLGDLDRGKWVHSYIKKADSRIELDLLLSSSLLTMYSKCGEMDSAKELFDQMPEKGVVAWNSMIIGYGMRGRGKEAVELFLEMEREGPRPNETTFVCLLSACAHAGLVLEGWWCFDRMLRKYNIKPRVDHYGCMVDLLGRAGLLSDSEQLLEKLPVKPGAALLGALLSACTTHSDLKLGEAVGAKLMEVDPNDVGPYVLLSNIYAAEGRWDDVEKMRTIMSGRGLLKEAGISAVSPGKSEDLCVLEQKIPVHKKGIVLSMLSEMGAQMKLSS